MTDRQQVEEMLSRAGVVWYVKDDAGDTGGPYGFEPVAYASTIFIETLEGPKNAGYPGFVAHFYFDADGALVAMGAWE